MTDTSRQGDRPRSRLHAMRRPYEDGVPKQDTKSGKRIAHAGLGHVHPLGCSRDVPLLNKHRSEEHTSELQSLMRISYAVYCLKKNTHSVTLEEHQFKP